ncbi:MAG TPA: hypothetical protein VHN37_01960 [Actinomycetota bacterium]|nr:hypothetical protein [Actinomycetota bacterium]
MSDEKQEEQDFQRHLIAIGKVASNFALLEVMTSHLCRAFLGTNAAATEVISRNVTYGRLLDVIGGLAILRLPEGEARKELFRVLQLAQNAATARNNILHSPYAAPDEGAPGGDVLKRVHRRATRTKGLLPSETNEGTAEIEQTVPQIHQVVAEIQSLADVLDEAAPDVAARLREMPTLG